MYAATDRFTCRPTHLPTCLLLPTLRLRLHRTASHHTPTMLTTNSFPSPPSCSHFDATGHAPSQDCRGGKHSVPSEANASSQQDNGVDSGGGETRAGPEEELAVPVKTGPIDDDAAVVATPVHHSAAAIIPEEEQGGDEDSPATPTLADWEISEVRCG